MKKLISILLATLLIFSVMAPMINVFAADADDTPIVMLRGDGPAISRKNPDGTEEVVYPIELGEMGDKIGETAVNILLPFLTEGLLFDKWDNYYKVCYEELSPIFEDIIMDDNGDPKNNTGITYSAANTNLYNSQYNVLSWKQNYTVDDYVFTYDWRLTPEAVVDELHEYIVRVFNATGRKVTLAGNCLGGSYVLAYLEKYCTGDNTEGLKYIEKVFFNATVGNGTDIITDIYCGDVEINAKGLQRFLDEFLNQTNPAYNGFINLASEFNDAIVTTVNLLSETGVIDKLGLTFDEVYEKVYEVLVPMLVIAFYGTMPGYWTIVKAERFEEAKAFVFGTEEYKTKYAGLIEKIDKHYNEVSSRIPEIIAECEANGLYFGATAKYGVQMYPFVKSQNKYADEQASFIEASFGATTAKDIFAVLSDSYIENAKADGTYKYISLDKKIDASTSIFKDSLWIQKNVPHTRWDNDYRIIEKFASTPNFNVWMDAAYPQYMIMLPETVKYDEEGNKIAESEDIVPMTEENCNADLWENIPDSSKTDEKPTILSRLIALFKWLTAMFKMIFKLSE